jgi:hypothetical protein
MVESNSEFQWQKVMPLGELTLRSVSGHTVVHSPLYNKLYLFGGSDGKSVFKDVWVYDLDQETW